MYVNYTGLACACACLRRNVCVVGCTRVLYGSPQSACDSNARVSMNLHAFLVHARAVTSMFLFEFSRAVCKPCSTILLNDVDDSRRFLVYMKACTQGGSQ